MVISFELTMREEALKSKQRQIAHEALARVPKLLAHDWFGSLLQRVLEDDELIRGDCSLNG